jgi:NAD/NADP transhydrogenase beta subunit
MYAIAKSYWPAAILSAFMMLMAFRFITDASSPSRGWLYGPILFLYIIAIVASLSNQKTHETWEVALVMAGMTILFFLGFFTLTNGGTNFSQTYTQIICAILFGVSLIGAFYNNITEMTKAKTDKSCCIAWRVTHLCVMILISGVYLYRFTKTRTPSPALSFGSMELDSVL